MKDFDLSEIDAQDEAILNLKHPKTDEPTGWCWTFFGPAHPRTIEVADKVMREALRVQQAQTQAQVNGKKWKAEDETPDDLRARTVSNIVARLKSFSPVRMSGDLIEFSPEKATELLLDRKKLWLYDQVYEFLRANESFIQPSAKS